MRSALSSMLRVNSVLGDGIELGFLFLLCTTRVPSPPARSCISIEIWGGFFYTCPAGGFWQVSCHNTLDRLRLVVCRLRKLAAPFGPESIE